MQEQQRIVFEKITENISEFFKTVIPVAITAARKQCSRTEHLWEYDKNGTVAKAYAEFTREVIHCGENREINMNLPSSR